MNTRTPLFEKAQKKAFLPFTIIIVTLVYVSIPIPAAAMFVTPTDLGELLDSPLDGAPDSIFPGVTNTALSNTHESRAFFEFDLSSAPGIVTESILTLGPINTTFSQCGDLLPCPLISSFSVYSYTADGSVTFSDYSLGTLVAIVTPAPADDTYLTLDVTLVVQASVANGDPFIGFATRANSQGAISFGAATPTFGLHMLTLVPEPSTLSLAVVLLVGIAIRRRRRV